MRPKTWTDLVVLSLVVVAVLLGVLLGAGLAQTGTLRFLVNSVALTIMLYAIFALGLNVVVGYTGLLDLGYATFVGIGAYVMAIGLMVTAQEETAYPDLALSKVVLTQEQRQAPPDPGQQVIVRERHDLKFDVVSGAGAVVAAQQAGQKKVAARHQGGLALPVGQAVPHGGPAFRFPGSFLALLLLAGGVSAVAGLVRGFPTLRLTGDYYAIVTLGFAEIVLLIMKNEEWLTGGAFGIKLGGQFLPTLLGEPLYYDTARFYFLVLAVLVLVAVAVRRLHDSRLGRSWAAIKADETAARASGIDVDKAKMVAFAVSGFIGGVGGALFAVKLTTITPGSFDIWVSILVVCCLVLGGMGSVPGAILGACILAGGSELLRLADESRLGRFALPPEARFLVYGVLLVVLMRFRSQGLLPARREGPCPDEARLAELRTTPSGLFALERKP